MRRSFLKGGRMLRDGGRVTHRIMGRREEGKDGKGKGKTEASLLKPELSNFEENNVLRFI